MSTGRAPLQVRRQSMPLKAISSKHSSNCLTSGAFQDSRARRRHKDIINLFEDTLAANSNRAARTTEICAAIGLLERTLRGCCTEILGVSAAKYMRVRRL